MFFKHSIGEGVKEKGERRMENGEWRNHDEVRGERGTGSVRRDKQMTSDRDT